MRGAVLTLATGKPVYVRMAVNLARSFLWWHRDSDIRFALATDSKHLLPGDLNGVDVIELAPGQLGRGFSSKLHIDEIAPADRTLFVDADCLCVGSLEPTFAKFAGHAVSVAGRVGTPAEVSEGDWFGDVKAVCSRFGVRALPYFNGGVYYLERGAACTRIYETARKLERDYDAMGLVRLRGLPNEELLMAIAMALHGETAVPDDGSVLSEQLCVDQVALDVLRGGSWYASSYSHELGRNLDTRLSDMHPVLVHFLGGTTARHPYRREELRLELAAGRRWPVWAADLAAAACRSLPMLTARGAKDALRPAYRRLFGTRKVAEGDRA
jgi:hypothetical protein